MKKNVDEYLDLAKNIKLKNIHAHKAEIMDLLESESYKYNWLKRFIFKHFRRLAVMSILSIIPILFLGIQFLSSIDNEKINENLATPSKKARNTECERLISEQPTTNKILSETNEIAKPLAKNEEKFFDFECYKWYLLKFDAKEWSFKWTYKIEAIHNYDINGKFTQGFRHNLTSTNDQNLLTALRKLEDTLVNLVDINILKSYSYLDIDEYFAKLAEYCELYSKDYSKDLIGMINLYSHLNRKFLNNPKEIMKIKSKGLILDKTTLNNLGIVITDTTVSIPNDEYFDSDPLRLERAKWYRSDKIRNYIVRYDSSIIKKNLVFEWTKPLSMYRSDGTVNWMNSLTPKRFKDAAAIKRSSSDRITTYQYDEVLGVEKFDEFRRMSPIYAQEHGGNSYQDAILLRSNLSGKKLFDYSFELAKKVDEYHKNKASVDTEENNDEYSKLYNKLQIIENIFYSFRYKYLVPVRIHLPYYGLTETELEKNNAQYITLWYYPNEEFLNALPEGVKNQLLMELNLFDQLQKGIAQKDEICRTFDEDKMLLGICDFEKSNISKLSLFPNPSSSLINIKFKLTKPNFVKVVLIDNNGKFVRDLSNWQMLQSKDINMSFDVSELNSGIYYLQVITESGDKAVSNCIIRK